MLVATDGSPASKAAVDWAASEAASRREPLLILTACPPVEFPASSEDTAAVAMMSSVLDAARMRRKEYHEVVWQAVDRVRRRHPSLVIKTEVFDGDPRKALELYSPSASVVVLGSRGLGSVRTVLLGSVSFWATRHLDVPIIVVRPSDTERLYVKPSIAVGIASDGSSEATLREAFALAARRACSVTIANATWDDEASGKGWKEIPLDEVEPRRREAVTALAKRVAQEYPDIEYEVLFARGTVNNVLAALGHTHEALVLGRRRSTVLDVVGLGCVASAVIEHALGATMIVPIEGTRP